MWQCNNGNGACDIWLPLLLFALKKEKRDVDRQGDEAKAVYRRGSPIAIGPTCLPLRGVGRRFLWRCRISSQFSVYSFQFKCKYKFGRQRLYWYSTENCILKTANWPPIISYIYAHHKLIRLRYYIIALIFFAAGMQAVGQANTQRVYSSADPMYKYNIDSAFALLDNKDFAHAIPFLQAALKITDKSYSTTLKLAGAFNKTEQTDKCFEILHKLCNTHWDLLSAFFEQQENS